MASVSWSRKASEDLQLFSNYPNNQRATLREQIIAWAGGAGWNVGDQQTQSFKIGRQIVHASAKRTAANKTEILHVDAD